MAKTVITVSLDDEVIEYLRYAQRTISSTHPAVNLNRSALVNHFIREGMKNPALMVPLVTTSEYLNYEHRHACGE